MNVQSFCKKIYNTLFAFVIVFRREKPRIQILDLQKAKMLNSTPELIALKGRVLDKSKKPRSVLLLGGESKSHAVTHPQGWIYAIARNMQVDTCLLLTDNDEKIILIRTPSKVERVE